MIIFGTIIFILLALVLQIGIAILISIPVLGFVMIIAGALIGKIKRDTIPVLWIILSTVTTVALTLWLWHDFFDATIDYGPAPLVLFVMYALGSWAWFNRKN